MKGLCKRTNDKFVTRRLKVSRKWAARDGVYGGYNPVITLTGKWLGDCGFKRGDALTLKVYQKKIIIEIETSPANL
ncbi:SymE family type I addiction module toxin [Sphingobacterium paludis]|uniref:Type I toxin-antitoxin system toxin SymE n=1 Tax=Sphingobacterium paludis TaxID=1476465 RepID=A0A4R7CX87_9SPHI|nr:SymE family type I addiction module toxin [Sphingobacterium paludis]TDS12311.1 type I toxin-antitoxin system toxin SymE [Sphingobacterium paludis]